MSNTIHIPSATDLIKALRDVDDSICHGLADGKVASVIKEKKHELQAIFELNCKTGPKVAHLQEVFDQPIFFWSFLKAWKEVKQAGRTPEFLRQHIQNMEAFDKMVTGPMSHIATAVAMPGMILQTATHSVVQDVPLRAGNTSNSDAMRRIPSAQDPQQPMDEQITRRVRHRPSRVRTESPEYKSSTSRKLKSWHIIEVLDEPSAEEEEYDEEDEDVQMDILEIPATAVVAESSRSAQTRAGKSARHIQEVLAPSDKHYTGRFSAIEKGKNRDLPEATNDEELAARVDILSTKLDSVTADAASALSMAYECNLACVKLEKSAAHGPNAGLGHRVTQLEGKMNDILGKLDMFETQFSDISTIVHKLSTNGMLILNQGASGPIQSVEDDLMGNNMEVEKDIELVSDGPHEAKNVDANSIMQTVELSANIGSVAGGESVLTFVPIVEPRQQDNSDSGPYVPISLPMVEQHGEDDSVSGPDPSNSMIHVNDAQEEQRELILSVHKDFPSVQLIPPTPNNSQEQATYSAHIIVAGTHEAASTVPENTTSAELAPYTTHTSPTLQALKSLPNLVETSTHLGPITVGPDDVHVGSEVGNGVELSVAGGSESVDIRYRSRTNFVGCASSYSCCNAVSSYSASTITE
ncbi:hypothetical protein CVT25_004377 [Psilocybe cyanescens]|uniref:Uncharacterized protein n=1 Tax=Psilocybe cyanescens TaxID=93625 RepID=A0A409XVV4_PSICY|nr:hypothetical protein CVT25_004377 [Psilocybe cyanescens]